MNALVMCGGRGSRLDHDTEKPLAPVAGTPMVDRVITGLDAAARVGQVYAAVSPNTPETTAHLRDDLRVEVVETPGEGYVADLGAAMSSVGPHAVTVAADLPLLPPEVVDEAVAVATDGTEIASVTVRTPAALKRSLGVSADEGEGWLPTGLNVVGTGDDRTLDTWDARLAVNVNYERDRTVAEEIVEGTDGA